MCLFPRLLKNRKYTSNKKNGGNIPAVSDVRTLYVPTGCGNCIECRKRKARDWQIRLSEEIKTSKNGKFITLTFSNESIQELCKTETLRTLEGYALDNAICTIAVRRFLERWRKKYKKSLRHWFVSELGHNGTENVHLHGIVWTDQPYEELRTIWNYGYIWPRKELKTYVSAQTVNYITKYVHKIDEQHKHYKSKVLTSPGIGRNYIHRMDARNNKFRGTDTNEQYTFNSGHKAALPIYYRNKIYTDKQKEELWLNKLDKNERFVCGDKCNADDTTEYYGLLDYHRKRNKTLGYGDDSKNWEEAEYEEKRRAIMHARRIPLNKYGYPADWD